MAASNPSQDPKDATQAPATKPPLVGDALIQQVLLLVNAERAKVGIAPLRVSTELCQAARSHCTDMAARGYFDYQSPDRTGGDLAGRIAASGYSGSTGADLNLGRSTPEEAVESWLGSPATRESLLRASYRDLGVGAVKGFWTILLGAPQLIATDETRAEMRDRLSRVRLGVPPLELHPSLSYAAQRHAFDMVTRKFKAETNPDGQDASARAKDAGFVGTVQELRVVGPETAEAACAALLGDASTSPVLGNMAARQVGIGMYEGAWTVLLGVPQADTVSTTESTSARVLELINAARTTAKVPPLSQNPLLSQAAEAHAGDMAATGQLGFEVAGKPGIAARIQQLGYKGKFFPAVTKGQAQPEGVVQLLLGSAAHRRQLLEPEFRELGVAVSKAHWALVLGAPPAESSADVLGTLLRLINAQRAASSVSPLALSPLLSKVAQDFAVDMGRRSFFGFSDPDGNSPDVLAHKAGFAGPATPAILRGYVLPEAALDAWMKSPQNRLNLLDPSNVHVGIGVAESRWVLILGGDG